MFRKLIAFIPVAAAMTVMAPAVLAGDAKTTLPEWLSVTLPFELENDWAFDSDDRANQNNDLYLKVEPEATIRLGSGLSVFAHAVAEPQGDIQQFENRSFEDVGVYMEDLWLEFNHSGFQVIGGKFHPGFGVAWDIAPGVYGTDFAEETYETAERVGFIGAYNFGNARVGSHTVWASTFFLDTSFLSETVGRGRGITSKSDGGVSNTEDFSSFLVGLRGENIPGLGALGYHISFMHQAAGEGDAEDENAFSIAAFSEFELGNDFSFSPMIEYTHFKDTAGVTGEDRDMIYLGGQLDWRNWNLAVVLSLRDTDKPEAGTEDDEDTHFQISAGYTFDFGLTIDVGYKTTNESRIETQTVGAIATYTIEF